MTDHARQWRLSVEGRLADLRAKHGRDLEDAPLPAWLDSLEGALQRSAADQPKSHALVRRPLPADDRAVSGGQLQPIVNGGPVEQVPAVIRIEV